MRKLNLDKKMIIAIVVCCVFVLDIFIILPMQIKGFAKVRKHIKDLKKEIGTLLDQGSLSMQTLEKQKKKLSEVTIPALAGKLIRSRDIFMVSEYVSRRAKENDIEILELIAKQPQKYKKTQEGEIFYRPITIETKARFHDMARFLNVLERGGYFLEVKELSIKQGSPYHAFTVTIAALQKD